MDLLRTAVVDITTMVATCHALKSAPEEAGPGLKRKHRDRLRRDVKRGTFAYIDALARSRHGVVDEALLAGWRVAAERQMPHAILHQALLGRMMDTATGSLDGLAAARQDLWRLAHMAIHLVAGMARLRASGTPRQVRAADTLARRLQRRFRKALIAYARAALRTRASRGRLLQTARAAALAEIGARGAACAQRLAAIEVGTHPSHTLLRKGVSQSIDDLALDWRRSERAAG